MHLWGRKLDPATGKLVGPAKIYQFGPDPGHKVEVSWVSSDADARIIRGIGVSADGENMNVLEIYTGRIVPA